MPNVSYCVNENEVHYNPYVEPPQPSNIITYRATAKLTETEGMDYYTDGLHVNSFSGDGGQLTMINHTFDNGIGTIEFNGDVTNIGNYAFYCCTGLTSINIPDSVTSIGNEVFFNCKFTELTIPNSVETIGIGTFNNCTSLTSVVIPNSVTNIEYRAFQNCTSLTSIVSNATTAPSIKMNTFNLNSTGGTLYVPIGSSGYDVWMQNASTYLGYYGWTKVEQ